VGQTLRGRALQKKTGGKTDQCRGGTGPPPPLARADTSAGHCGCENIPDDEKRQLQEKFRWPASVRQIIHAPRSSTTTVLPLKPHRHVSPAFN